MYLKRLYIENFMCHENSYIDFSLFNSALIIGKIENNDNYSNGVGKTSIFKALEFCLFNQSADINLEKIIRDDTDVCKVILDFIVSDQEYRLSRQRTKKGATDVSFLQRTSNIGSDEEIYHKLISNDIYAPIKNDNSKFWKDLSGRRAADTEKELEKLIKINFKAFRSTVHFVQNDFSGLTTASPEKRKAILKDALNLAIYSKLEKIAKDKTNLLSKDINKCSIVLESIGDLESELTNLNLQYTIIESSILSKMDQIKDPTKVLILENEKINKLVSYHKELENKYSSSLNKEKEISNEKEKIENSLKEYQNKKLISSKLAKEIVRDISSLKDSSKLLSNKDYSQIEILYNKINNLKQQIIYNNIIIQNNNVIYEDLKIPVPDENLCKHCRQLMTDEHKQNCKIQIAEEIEVCLNNIKNSKKENITLNNEVSQLQNIMNKLLVSKQELDDTNNKILSKDKELKDKKNLYNEYLNLSDKYLLELKDKEAELTSIKIELENSSITEANKILVLIEEKKKIISDNNNIINSLNKEIFNLNASKAVIQHNLDQNTNNTMKANIIKKNLSALEDKIALYPQVNKAFSSTGIPNLIIQNVLDTLQQKANDFLMQLKPGLQLSFFIEKTKTDGTEADTLDINYYVNGRERYYGQLSGAMQLAVTFSLKLGLSFLLQEMIGTNIKFLLLDEIDQCLDKASVDAFADIIKFFQKDFTILIITHNDHLKHKFAQYICVEQDANMVSHAKVSSW